MADIWDFQRKLTARLLAWAGVSFSLGVAMILQKDRRIRGAGSQFMAWAVVNGLIAILGARASLAKRQKVNAGILPAIETMRKDTRGLRRILWLNTGLDVVYILAGLVLRQTKGAEDARMHGMGEAVAIQGAALLFFDLVHALLIPQPAPPGANA